MDASLNPVDNLARPVWTAAEEAVLTRLYASHGAAGLTDHLPGRSVNAICKRAQGLGLSSRTMNRWTDAEMAVMRRLYPDHGAKAVQAEIRAQGWPDRSLQSIMVQAAKKGIACNIRAQAPTLRMSVREIAEAMRLHDSGQSYCEIGRLLNYAPTTVSNAILIEEGKRRGFTFAERDGNGCLTDAGVKQVWGMIRSGTKGVDIQMRCGVSAACVAEQRRKYARWCKINRIVPPPPPGKGEAYAGAKIPREKVREVETLLMEGFGCKKINARSGVSITTISRIRAKLVRRLKRKGECLPGCDKSGTRRRQLESIRFIPDAARAEFRGLLMDRIPVKRAAVMVGMGLCSAYRERDALREELAARGEELPKPKLPGRVRGKLPELRALEEWMPEGPDGMYRYRALVHAHGAEAAKAMLKAEKAEALAARIKARSQPKRLTFEEQLARVAGGTGLVANFKPTRAAHDFTLGGVSSGAL